MSLHKLAHEIEETARQTAVMAEAVAGALAIMSGQTPRETAQQEAVRQIVTALQGEDRIRQRSQSLAHAARQFANLPTGAPASAYDAIWSSLCMDELRLAPCPAPVHELPSGNVELF